MKSLWKLVQELKAAKLKYPAEANLPLVEILKKNSWLKRTGKGSQWFFDRKNSKRMMGIKLKEIDFHAVHDIARQEGYRFDHNGWYCDDYQDALYVGGCVKFGKTYFPAYLDEEADTVIIELDPESGDGAKWNAAKCGDSMAEIDAEQSREYCIKDQAELDIEYAKEEISNLRVDARNLIAGIRESVLAPAVCDEMRNSIRRIRNDMHKAWRLIEKRKDDPMSAANNW